MAKKKKVIEYSLELYQPHEAQLKIHQSDKRFRIVSFGRQSGKSTFGLNEMIRHAWEKPNTRYWFVSPIYDQAKTQYERLLFLCKETGVLKDKRDKGWNDSEFSVTLINGSFIQFQSGQKYDTLRGDTLDGVVIDEVRDQHPKLWPLVLRAMVAAKKGWALFTGTPNGFDHFYDLWEQASKDQTWERFHSPSTCNPLFDQDEFESARKNMTEAEFAQEILAEFRDLTAGRAYATFSQDNISPTSFFCDGKYTPHLQIVLHVDFNINPMSWCLAQYNAGKGYFFDEIFIQNTHTAEAAMVLVEKLNNYANKYDLLIIGDASGKARQRAASNQSDFDIIHKVLGDHGIKFLNITDESNPSIRDRVNTVNTRLKSAAGEISVKIHPDCKMLIKDFQRVVWKSGEGVLLDSGPEKLLTHMSDAAGYGIYKLLPINKISDVGSLKVIRR